MKKFNLGCPHRKPNLYKQAYGLGYPGAPHPSQQLAEGFQKNIPVLALLTDITFSLMPRAETAYLSTILDSSTGEVLANKLSDRIILSIATETIDALVKQRRVKLHKDAFIHSVQGSHYVSPKYQALLKRKGLGQSMSRGSTSEAVTTRNKEEN